mmetsp:Transcript_38921/g.84718  ORF Transcript_38921/g.84718 Transcript_38921/m.84718 type:complete len:157 (+) Transcript_38921:2-472(+)
MRCSEIALELSSMRWLVLRQPILVVYLVTLLLLGLPLLIPQAGVAMEPSVPLYLGLCFLGPLLLALFVAAAANKQVGQQIQRLQAESEETLSQWVSSGDGPDESQYVQAHIRACTALSASTLKWPGEREITFLEPVVLLMAAAASAGGLWVMGVLF